MANTYTQIHIQAIFAMQNRHCLIDKKWEIELYKYITGIIQIATKIVFIQVQSVKIISGAKLLNMAYYKSKIYGYS